MKDGEGLPQALIEITYDNLTPRAKAGQALTIADNFLTTVESRIAKTGVGEIAADVARNKAAFLVECMLTGVHFDLISRSLVSVGPLDVDDVQATNRDDFFKQLDDKIGALQFSTNFTPEAQPMEKIYQIQEMLKNYRFNLACGVAQRLLPKFPELAKYVETCSGISMRTFIEDYGKKHDNAPEYLYEMAMICLYLKRIKDENPAPERLESIIYKIRDLQFEFMRQVASEALTEKEQQRLGQILAYGNDLKFGRKTLFI